MLGSYGMVMINCWSVRVQWARRYECPSSCVTVIVIIIMYHCICVCVCCVRMSEQGTV